MRYDNERLTGHLRWVDKTEFMHDKDVVKTHVLQQQWECWNADRPSDIKTVWRDVPRVHITELINDTPMGI